MFWLAVLKKGVWPRDRKELGVLKKKDLIMKKNKED